MATIYDLKPAFQNLLRPFVSILHSKGITPNHITWAALLLSMIMGMIILIFKDNLFVFFMIPIALFIRMALNALDGMLANQHNMQSNKGAILNEMGDVLSDTAIYLPLAVLSGFGTVAVVLFVVVGIFTEFAGVLSQAVCNQRRYDGPMGKSDRAFLIGLIALFLAFGINAGEWIDILLFIGVALGILTTLNRLNKALA